MTKLFVFDLHGTLEEGSNILAGRITNTVLKRNGYSVQMTEAQMREFFGIHWHEYFQR